MRYNRQIMMPNIGPEGQIRLKNSRVLVVGAGGLGSPVIFYLAAAGVGSLKIIDYDHIEESNLNRQILHFQKDIGRPKALSAVEKIAAFSPETELLPIVDKLTSENAPQLVQGCDCVVSCLDNIPSRFLVARACQEQGIPLVDGGISGFSGFVMSSKPGTSCIGCLYGIQKTNLPPPGVIGACAGVAGSMQASEALKILLGIETPLYGHVLFFDLLSMQFQKIELSQNDHCPICGAT